MKILKLLSFLAFLPVFLSLSTSALAKQEIENVVVKKDEIINHDFFAAGNNVTISGIINGDLYAAGGTVTIDGIINGDLLVAGGTISLLGEVSDDVRAAGGNFYLNGKVGKNVTVFGGNITLSSQASLAGSLLAGAGNLEIGAPIGKDARLYAQNVVIDSQIGGNLKGAMEKLSLKAGAKINGDLNYESPQVALIDKQATVSGQTLYQVSQTPQKIKNKSLTPNKFSKSHLVLEIFSFLFSYLFGYAFIKIFSNRFKSILNLINTQFKKSFFYGVLSFFILPFILIILCVSLIGIPLAVFLLPIFVFLIYLSKTFMAIYLGEKIILKFQGKPSREAALFFGLLLYYLLRLIPIVSSLTFLAYSAFGLGAFVLSFKKSPATIKKAS